MKLGFIGLGTMGRHMARHLVEAGHDVFDEQLVAEYFKTYWPDLGLDEQAFMQLARTPGELARGLGVPGFIAGTMVFMDMLFTAVLGSWLFQVK